MFVVLTSLDLREENKEIGSLGIYTSCLYFSFCHCEREEGIHLVNIHTAYLCGVSVFKTGKIKILCMSEYLAWSYSCCSAL